MDFKASKGIVNHIVGIKSHDRLITISNDSHTIRSWDPKNGSAVNDTNREKPTIYAVEYGGYLWTIEGNSISVWNVNTLEVLLVCNDNLKPLQIVHVDSRVFCSLSESHVTF